MAKDDMIRLTVTMPREIVRAIERVAEANYEASRSSIVRRMLTKTLKAEGALPEDYHPKRSWTPTPMATDDNMTNPEEE